MNWATALGALLCVVGLVGYGLGVFVAYPGRAFSVTALVTGFTLVAVFRRSTEDNT